MKELQIHVIQAEAVRQMDCSAVAERLPERYQKAQRYLREQDRLLCLGAGLLILEVLGVQDERELVYGPNGKPYISGGMPFSISHSGSTCILACGNVAQLGADIEEIDERHIDIASAVYTERELAWMQADPVERFFRLWTWKECVMKATGLGMALAPQSFDVLPFAEDRPARVRGQSWYAWGQRLGQSRIAVCADEPFDQVRLMEHGNRM